MNKRTRILVAASSLVLGLLLMGKPILDILHKESREEENRDKEEREKKNRPEPSGSRYLVMTDSQIILQHIGFAVPQRASLKKYRTFPGEITLNAERVVRLSPRFAGVVREVKVELGDPVDKGQVLAVLESNESLSPYEIKAPLQGRILEKKIKVGESLKEDDTAFVLADMSIVWVNFHLYPQDVGLLQRSKLLQVESLDNPMPGSNGTHGKPDWAKVTYVEPVADAETHTIRVRAEMQNPGNRWRPGLFVQGRIVVDSVRTLLAVPDEAVQSFNGQPSVYVKTPKGITPVTVVPGLSDGEKTEIKSGLESRDTVVSTNAYLIRSEFEKASFQEDEGDEEEEKAKDKD